jgi:hypothetical protein
VGFNDVGDKVVGAQSVAADTSRSVRVFGDVLPDVPGDAALGVHAAYVDDGGACEVCPLAGEPVLREVRATNQHV